MYRFWNTAEISKSLLFKGQTITIRSRNYSVEQQFGGEWLESGRALGSSHLLYWCWVNSCTPSKNFLLLSVGIKKISPPKNGLRMEILRLFHMNWNPFRANLSIHPVVEAHKNTLNRCRKYVCMIFFRRNHIFILQYMFFNSFFLFSYH